MAIEEFYKVYSEKGFLFSDELLTRYTLSLATKPFVILSGISGTGKTKIAQLFEIPLENSSQLPEAAKPTQMENQGYILLNVTEGLTAGDGRANLRFNQLSAVLEKDEVIELDRLVQEKRKQKDNGNICDPIPLIIETPEGDELEISLYLQRASSPLARLRAKSKKEDSRSYDCRPYFAQNYKINDVIKLVKVSKHRLRIEEVNDQKIIYEYKEEIEKYKSEINNKCFISVKSNWTDATELFGYFNPLTEKYTMTKLLRFLLKANDYPSQPFFLILDEMNLAKVEHYFSDFLSSLESRTVDQEGNIKQEGIHLYSGNDFIRTDDDEYDEIESTIKLPLNLYVTGTVNVDDTTYMFSPKVLDRANVIEFNEVYLEGMPEEKGIKLKNFPDFTSSQIAQINMYDELDEITKQYIKTILEILKKYNLHFGYRTISEMAHFIQNAKIYAISENDIEIHALDIQILQKVLPKLHGNYAKLNEPIKELIHFLSESKGELEFFNVNEIDLTKVIFKRSIVKLSKMYKVLSTQGFASYIE